ncbi:hypothetical protein XENTR_v10005654 [Xenopus tropicalis]|uniref:Phosphatidylinositol-glycan biosynthesis class W protein n=1 Tax=Xenopus tropicalis TaxID=8364 RepID=F6QUR5_XENTR|nr:phosphatidylinositol-glycan biosynthesis class W protein [Xenopus tropicalis]KAE8623561.1 hypothetical protein XENTR_v10005654 [Xenopus tropicalis]KAE8623562.1 hypothetical protein XENTR_v10005654 [Xenopus tropicalis]|eukprot:XP_017947029.1 PREDICTED: phosphatidylinositol-glycan biosynthesis class W protein [Xenopus tropicalis]
MNEKLLKESFISNLNGTSISEITAGLSISSLCFLFRGLLLVLYQEKYGPLNYSWKFHLSLDYFLLVFPLILSCTVFSDFLYIFPLSYTAACTLLFYIIYKRRTNCVKGQFICILKSFLNVHVEGETIPPVTNLRVFLNILTAISILAVDFPVFPRRYAKTETYGTGVMDLGVGGFIFANAIVSPEAKAREAVTLNRFSNLKKQLVSVWPLFILGFGRLISVKAADYHEHVSEYGVHWNFFFTLAIVRVLASFLLAVFPAKNSWVLAATFVFLYQLALETTGLKDFVFYGSDGKGTRVGFFNANREGIVSVTGYVAIYVAGVQVGIYVLKKRAVLKDWISALWNLMIIVLLLFAIFHLFQIYIEPVSRRLANVTFFIWIIAQCLSFLCLIFVCDLIMVLAKYLVPGSRIPGTWVICKSSFSTKKGTKLKEGKKESSFCLIQAVSRNQLLFFLLSNILTGLVNMMVNTMTTTSFLSLLVLVLYMFCTCLIVYFLHINSVTVKWW